MIYRMLMFICLSLSFNVMAANKWDSFVVKAENANNITANLIQSDDFEHRIIGFFALTPQCNSGDAMMNVKGFARSNNINFKVHCSIMGEKVITIYVTQTYYDQEFLIEQFKLSDFVYVDGIKFSSLNFKDEFKRSFLQ